MNSRVAEEVNQEINFEEGKIYWADGKGWTSKLLKEITKKGFYVIQAGSVYELKNKEGVTICNGYSWIGLLRNVSLTYQINLENMENKENKEETL